MRVVRNFCLYRRRSEPASFLPDARLFPPRHQVVRPPLFKNEEVVRLLAIISELPAALTSPFRRENLRLAIALLYTTGLRLGELAIFACQFRSNAVNAYPTIGYFVFVYRMFRGKLSLGSDGYGH